MTDNLKRLADASASLDSIEVTLHARYAPLLEAKAQRAAILERIGLYHHAAALDECCSDWHVYHYEDSDTIEAYPERCRNRFCPICSDFERRKWRSKFSSAIQKMPGCRFVTLTYPPTNECLADCITSIKRAFGKLRRRRLWTSSITGGLWIVGLSMTENDWHPHIHCIVRGRSIDQHALSRAWFDVSDAHIVDIRRVYSDELLDYLVRHFEPSSLSSISDEQMLNYVQALHGQRLVGAFGNCRFSTTKELLEEEGGDRRNDLGLLSGLANRAYNGDDNAISVLSTLETTLLMSLPETTVL